MISAEKDKKLFDSIANGYSQKDKYIPSQYARKHRLLQTIRKLEDYNLGKVLEVGCGAGYSASYLKGRYNDFTGIDYSENLIKIAKDNFEEDSIHFINSDFLEYSAGKSFDVIFMIGVLHHIENSEKVLKKLYELLSKKGSIIINEPQSSNHFFEYLRKIRKKIDKDYSDEQKPFFSEDLFHKVQKINFRNIQSFPQGYISTPFAEVLFRPKFLFKHISKFACCSDYLLEENRFKTTDYSWNIIVKAEK